MLWRLGTNNRTCDSGTRLKNSRRSNESLQRWRRMRVVLSVNRRNLAHERDQSMNIALWYCEVCHEKSVATQFQNRGAVATGSNLSLAQLTTCHSIQNRGAVATGSNLSPTQPTACHSIKDSNLWQRLCALSTSRVSGCLDLELSGTSSVDREHLGPGRYRSVL